MRDNHESALILEQKSALKKVARDLREETGLRKRIGHDVEFKETIHWSDALWMTGGLVDVRCNGSWVWDSLWATQQSMQKDQPVAVWRIAEAEKAAADREGNWRITFSSEGIRAVYERRGPGRWELVHCRTRDGRAWG